LFGGISFLPPSLGRLRLAQPAAFRKSSHRNLENPAIAMMSRTTKIVVIARKLRHAAEFISSMLLLAMFLSFMTQIISRYVFNNPLGWTDEVSVLCWVWCVLWGAAFVLRERDEVRFDLIYSSASERTRCVFTVITGVAAIALFGIALPAVISYVLFLKVEKSAYLGIRLDYLYSIYIVFSVATVVRYAAMVWYAIRGRAPGIQLGAGSAL
jgi:TRAP-type C4-dicarboxylate transport system permease small subunit